MINLISVRLCDCDSSGDDNSRCGDGEQLRGESGTGRMVLPMVQLCIRREKASSRTKATGRNNKFENQKDDP